MHREFLVCSREPAPSLVETLAAVVFYHHGEGLDVGHTFPIGQPWVAGASLEYFLVSRPYPFSPDLENCWIAGHHIRLLWLLPVYETECRFRHREGFEALESRFDAAGFDILALDRPPVV